LLMDRDSKGEYMARTSTLVAVVVVHGLIFSALLAHIFTVRSMVVVSPQPIFVHDYGQAAPTARRLEAPNAARYVYCS
jgi:hypothetical protein